MDCDKQVQGSMRLNTQNFQYYNLNSNVADGFCARSCQKMIFFVLLVSIDSGWRRLFLNANVHGDDRPTLLPAGPGRRPSENRSVQADIQMAIFYLDSNDFDF